MEKRYLFAAVLLMVGVGSIVFAYNVSAYSKTYQFAYATEAQTNNPDGLVVFHLSDGSTLNFSNAYTREDVQPSQMVTGGYIVVQYSFVGYPVQVDYLAAGRTVAS